MALDLVVLGPVQLLDGRTEFVGADSTTSVFIVRFAPTEIG